MTLRAIHIDTFRNLAKQTIEFGDGVHLFSGQNGQGKTNFLEAVHFLAALRSFRLASVRDLIRRGETRAFVGGQLEGDVPFELKVGLEPTGRRLWIGQRQVASVAEYLGLLPVVAFTPDDLTMIKGGPLTRRRFLDRAVFLFDRGHLENMRAFGTALRARNRLLGLGGRELAEVRSFSALLANHGARVSTARKAVLALLEPHFDRFLRMLFAIDVSSAIAFRSGWGSVPIEQNALQERLSEVLALDQARRRTTIGSQSDDFEVQFAGLDARRFASQGQQRACAIALLLAVVALLLEQPGRRPVLLLDDISSELDFTVRSRLLGYLRALACQVLVTSTDLGLAQDLDVAPGCRWEVRGGSLFCP